MLGHYGWIMALDDIEHPDAKRNGGRVYVSARDVEEGMPLQAGDLVDFSLYVDRQGLGAEACRLVCRRPDGAAPEHPQRNPLPVAPLGGRWWWQPRLWDMSPDAEEFVPGNSAQAHAASELRTSGILSAGAPEFFPLAAGDSGNSQAPASSSAKHGMNRSAPEFFPAGAGPSARGSAVLALNDTLRYDSSSEKSSSHGHGSQSDLGGRWGDGESCAGETSCGASDAAVDANASGPPLVLDDDLHWDCDLGVVVLSAPIKPLRAASADASTSAGLSSDSEDANTELCKMRAPPGLSLLTAW